MEGINRSIFEIFEIILAVSLLLLISTAIILTNKPNFIYASLIASETSQISDIINKNTKISINYNQNNIKDNFNIKNNQNTNQIEVSFKDKSIAKTNYIGNKDITISNNKKNSKIITITS